MKIREILLVLFIWMVVLPMAPLHAELLCDPGFELSLPNGTFPSSGCWKDSHAPGTAGAACTSTAAHNGSRGLWVYTGNEPGAWWSGPYQEFPCQPGEKYEASAWVRVPAVGQGGSWVSGSKAAVRVEFRDQNKNLINYYESPSLQGVNDWQNLAGTTPPAPAGAAYTRFVCYLEKPQVTGQSIANFDDCHFLKIISPSLNFSGPPVLGFGMQTLERQITIENKGSGVLSWQLAPSASWIRLSQTSGETAPAGTSTITVQVVRDGLSAANYYGTIQITSDGGEGLAEIYMGVTAAWIIPDRPAEVRVEGRKLLVRPRLPDGTLGARRSYIIKGAAWSPASVCTANDPFTRQQEFAKWYELDLQMIAMMGANTVYVFLDFGVDPGIALPILNTIYKYGLMAVITVDWDGSGNLKNEIVEAYKNHPAVLMWAVGNEWNINLYHAKCPDVSSAANLTENLASAIKGLDPSHPVASIYGEINIAGQTPDTQTIVQQRCPSVDIWGLNIYRGDNFSDLFETWKNLTGKPMFISEFGTDSYKTTSYSPVQGYEDESMQKLFEEKLLLDLRNNLVAMKAGKVCLGGCIFAWNDEWWKVKTADGGSPCRQDNGGFETWWNHNAHPDGFGNEEYFGIVKIDRTKKGVYGSIREQYLSWHPAAPAASISDLLLH